MKAKPMQQQDQLGLLFPRPFVRATMLPTTSTGKNGTPDPNKTWSTIANASTATLAFVSCRSQAV